MGLVENNKSTSVIENKSLNKGKNSPAKLRRLGTQLLYKVDNLIIGDSQPSARIILEIGGKEEVSKRIALRRIIETGAVGMQIAGSTVATAQLLAGGEWSHVYAALGVSAQAVGKVAELILTNRNGVDLQLALDNAYMEHGDKIPVVTELLKGEGLNGEEISSLNQLGGRIYNAELSSARIKNLQNIITPTLIAGIIYPYANEFLTAIFASAAGVSYWIGRTAFTSMNIVRAAATRAARSAKSIDWLSNLLEGHLKDVTKLNIISQTPTIATIITLLSASKDAAAGLLFATSFSLSGLVNTLTTKRAAVDAHRATEIVTGLGNVLNRETVLITDNSWDKFLSNNPPVEYNHAINFQRGLILDNVASELPNGSLTDIQNFSIIARSGEVTVIKGGSGKGKSQLWLGPRNITRYSGEVYIVDNGLATNTKSLPRREISKHIRIFGQGQINPKSELVDIFNPVFKLIDDQQYKIPLEKQELWNHIRDIEDNLLAADIIKRQGGSPNYLDMSLVPEITKFREARLAWVNNLLENAGGNLNIAGMHGKRVFGQDSLSDGQRQRIVMLLAELTANYNSEIKCIILDEPLDKLDHGLNVGLQLQAIGRIKNQTNGPGIIVISHQLVSRLSEQLGASVIDLD